MQEQGGALFTVCQLPPGDAGPRPQHGGVSHDDNCSTPPGQGPLSDVQPPDGRREPLRNERRRGEPHCPALRGLDQCGPWLDHARCVAPVHPRDGPAGGRSQQRDSLSRRILGEIVAWSHGHPNRDMDPAAGLVDETTYGGFQGATATWIVNLWASRPNRRESTITLAWRRSLARTTTRSPFHFIRTPVIPVIPVIPVSS